MIAQSNFIPLVRTAIPRFAAHPPNAEQQACILHPLPTPLMIAAGPGSGKTTVLVLRALRLVFVDGVMPEHIVLTTFTRKAAQELRSRLIEWGLLVKAHIESHPPAGAGPGFAAWLDAIDINRFVTGTLDSLCEELLTTHRDPADPAPVLVEGFVGNALLMREGLFPSRAHVNADLAAYLSMFTFEQEPPRNFAEVNAVCRSVIDRLIYDRVDITAYASGVPHTLGRAAVVAGANAYRAFMDNSNRMDFARLEEIFLERLSTGRLPRFVAGVRALLVDEYQDTNPLQESIYFEVVRQTGASFTVVGDDDQSLYRFRGATVELYRDFVARFRTLVPGLAAPLLLYLIQNYRSSPEIVGFFNSFIRNDPDFALARVQPLKPLIVPQLPSQGLPVLGMFRPDCQTLATDLSAFLVDIFRGAGRDVAVGSNTVRITRHQNGGDFGDAVVLSHTVNEYGSRFGDATPRARLPQLMRDELARHNVGVFNPRGRALRDIPVVQQLLGTVLDCIDPPTAAAPDGLHQAGLSSPPSVKLRGETQFYLRLWRQASRAFVATDPHPAIPHTLQQFVRAWQTRTSQTPEPWPREWPLLELCFKVISWIPMLRDDPEGQVYLEAMTRCVAQAATYSPYRSSIIHGQPPHDDNSVRRAILDMFAPLAESSVDVDEEIMPHVPRGRLPFMTIHQAKGLEYPLVIVDVASDYSTNSPKNRFRRFPEQPSNVHHLEDDLAPFCDIGPLRTTRPALARTFDDLIRLYYVAFSRPQSALVLVGLDRCLRYGTSIRHVGTGWRSDGTWAWRMDVRGRVPAMANNIPLTLI